MVKEKCRLREVRHSDTLGIKRSPRFCLALDEKSVSQDQIVHSQPQRREPLRERIVFREDLTHREGDVAIRHNIFDLLTLPVRRPRAEARSGT